MLRIGLTGGIASGKSTVASVFRAAGAMVVDADQLARQVVEPGTRGLADVVAAFGPGVLGAEGALDRAALARRVFADEEARRTLEAIVHPLVRAAGAEIEHGAAAGSVVVHDIPLLAEGGLASQFHAVVATEEDVEERVRRMVAERGMRDAEARARIAVQATDDERRRVADVVLAGGESIANRRARVQRLMGERFRPWAENIAAGHAVRRPTTVELLPHDPAWRRAAARQLHRFRYHLDGAGMQHRILGLDHIGSTSVAGLRSKPVLDLQIRVRGLADAVSPRFRDAMAAAGFFARDHQADTDDVYECLDPDPRQYRKFLFRGTDPAQVFHVHVREHTSAGARAALMFRDYLRSHDEAARRYEAAKLKAAASVATYPEAKAPWFAAEMPRCVQWARATGWRGPGPG